MKRIILLLFLYLIILSPNFGQKRLFSYDQAGNRTQDSPTAGYKTSILLTPNNSTTVKITITVSEINNIANNSLITVKAPIFQNGSAFSWNSTFSGTVIAGITANNNNWQYLGVSGGFYSWKYIGNGGLFVAGSDSRFIFEGPYNAQGTGGTSFYVETNYASTGAQAFNIF